MSGVCTAAVEYLDGLRDPILVWRFQNYFGVDRKSNDDGHAGKESNGDQPVSDTSRRRRGTLLHSRDNDSTWTAVTRNDDDGSKQQSPVTEDSEDSGIDNDGQRRGSDQVHIGNPFWYHMFCVGAALGDETFYSSFFPFWFWNVDGAVFRRVVMIWVLVMYVGQGLKDVVRWPRPPPPVIRLEEKWALEYGMPSTHAMVGGAIPFSFLFYTMYRYEYPVVLGLVVCVVWCSLVCGSRLYLGMHSVLDIVAGLLLASALMAIALPFADAIDAFVLTSAASPLCVLVCNVLLIYLYPETTVKVTRGDTVTILGVGAGVAWGSWLNFQLGIIRGPPLPPPYRILWPTCEMAGLMLLRTCIGVSIVLATRATLKSFTYAVASQVLRLDDRSSTEAGETTTTASSDRRRLAVELSSTFVTYAAVAFNITYLSPTVFRFLNIERLTMFTEV